MHFATAYDISERPPDNTNLQKTVEKEMLAYQAVPIKKQLPKNNTLSARKTLQISSIQCMYASPIAGPISGSPGENRGSSATEFSQEFFCFGLGSVSRIV